MTHSYLFIRTFVIFVLIMAALFVWSPLFVDTQSTSPYLTVRFLDVGQGDAIHIMTPDGYELLIDGGPSAAVLRELAQGRSFFDRKIDVVIATHPDTDHVAGLVDVLERYQVDWVIETAAESDTPAATAYEEVARAEGARTIIAQAGQTLQLGASTTVRILSPRGDTSNWRSNAASVIVQIVYGDIEFMLTGDAPSSIEEYLVGEYGELLESEVLKLGHHGSKTSTSQEFVDIVQPQFAVVSAGKDNRYGHPHFSVIDKVWKAEAEVVSTAEKGTVTFLSDGENVWISP